MAIKETGTSKTSQARPQTPHEIREKAWYLMCYLSPRSFTLKTLAGTMYTTQEAKHIPRAIRLLRVFVTKLANAGYVRALGHRLGGYYLYLMPSIPKGYTSTKMPISMVG